MAAAAHWRIHRVSFPSPSCGFSSALSRPHFMAGSQTAPCLANLELRTRFGIVATLLELVPFANYFFSFTNTGKFQPVQGFAEVCTYDACWLTSRLSFPSWCRPVGCRYRGEGDRNDSEHGPGTARGGKEGRVRDSRPIDPGAFLFFAGRRDRRRRIASLRRGYISIRAIR